MNELALPHTDYEDNDGTIVIPDEVDDTAPSYFGSVSIVNSNDVHFGNKTIYKGPVTIKQVVYPQLLDEQILKSLDLGDVKFGVDNPGNTCKVDENINNGKVGSVHGDGEETSEISRFRKGFPWINLHRKKQKVIFLSILGAIILSIVVICLLIYLMDQTQSETLYYEEDNNSPISYNTDSNGTLARRVRIVSRRGWLAQPPTGPVNQLKIPVDLVIIQHTATEGCLSQSQCIYQTRHIQTFHIESNGWFDIGYNFLVGGDGDAYEGRGWTKEGAHTFGYNNRSLGVAFIGTFIQEVPQRKQVDAFLKLMERGVELGYLKKEYKIMAARQLHATESPGKAFYENVIKKWSHWSEFL